MQTLWDQNTSVQLAVLESSPALVLIWPASSMCADYMNARFMRTEAAGGTISG